MNKYANLIIISLLLSVAGCSTRGEGVYRKVILPEKNSATKEYSVNPNGYSSEIDAKSHKHPTMKPYVIRGIKYYPTVVKVGDEFTGRASWYGPDFHGKLTSNGEKYNMFAMTAAHKTLPMNTIVKVTNKSNGLSTVVRINDRGPFVNTRIIDLSKKAANAVKMIGTGTAPVVLEILGFSAQSKKSLPTKKEMQSSVQKKSIGNFYLQIASFSKIDGAIKTQEKYEGIDGYKSIIKDIKTENGRIFKVMLKGFKSREEALDYKKKPLFKNAFIVKED